MNRQLLTRGMTLIELLLALTLGLLVGAALVIDGLSALLIGRRSHPGR